MPSLKSNLAKEKQPHKISDDAVVEKSLVQKKNYGVNATTWSGCIDNIVIMGDPVPGNATEISFLKEEDD